MKYLLVILAYLLGSIPFSFLFGKLFLGKDIRKLGSGNIGTTNAFRCFGKPIGFATLISDTLKSGLIVFIMLNTNWLAGLDLFHPLVYGLAAVVGHIFPIWFMFKGGKGVAASFGLLLVYNFGIGLLAVAVFLIVEYFTRYVSVASTVGAIFTLLWVTIRHLWFVEDLWLVLITLALVILIIFRHQANYKRLRMGTESRVRLFDKLDALINGHKK
ncbi:MAG: glycerol-3-phosphate 1-O-acyltransferase PlsY [Candidatus Izemoplasmatales bacterium]|jgi:glycerol-3-phosphate acyltransferase PlsY